MSRHSKNNTSSTIFTYGQRQKLKGVYGTIQTRLGQDSIKKFQMCTICSNRLIEPTSCDKGHMFCRSCIVEFLVKQRKKIAQNHKQYEKNIQREEKLKKEKELQAKVKEMEKFEKYDTFMQVTDRSALTKAQKSQKVEVTQKDVKPIGIYQLNPSKDKYLKTSFWTVENTPQIQEKSKKQDTKIKCPGADDAHSHNITLKKLRKIIVKQIQQDFVCQICNKQIGRQRIGAYKCGHLVCHSCKSDKCEICSQKEGWLEIQRSHSAFASHSKAQVKTYTHAYTF